MRRDGRALAMLAVAALTACAAVATADWLQPDPSLREAQLQLRLAERDTAGHGADPARLDALGVALLRLARFDEAQAVFRVVLELRPDDPIAAAGLGKMALFADRLAQAESLLTLAAGAPSARADLHALHLRRGDFARAARSAAEVGEAARGPLLQAMAENGSYRIAAGPDQARVQWTRSYPVPLVRVKVNGQSVLMALDTGSGDLLLDEWAARRAKVRPFPAQALSFWAGTRVAVRPALVQRLEIGGLRIEQVPAGVLKLRKWSIQVNPQSEPVAGVIGLGFLRAFTPTLDYRASVLELRRRGQGISAGPTAQRIPFEIWGESELTVYGSISGSRRLAMILHSGLPECGIAAPAELFEEVGARPGLVARAARKAGTLLQGQGWTRVTASRVEVGPVAADRVPGWAGALDPSELWRHGARRDAMLSHDFFARRRVTFDWDARELIVE